MHGSDSAHRATAVSLLLGALGCGALLFAVALMAFAASTGEALRAGGPLLGAAIVLWAAAAWVELWRRVSATGRARRRGTLAVRALGAALVALVSPVVVFVCADAAPLPGVLALAAALELWIVIGALPLRWLLRP